MLIAFWRTPTRWSQKSPSSPLDSAAVPTWDRLEFGDIAEVAAGILGPLTSAGILLDRSDEIVNAIVTRTGLPSIDAPDEASLMVPGRAAAADADIEGARCTRVHGGPLCEIFHKVLA